VAVDDPEHHHQGDIKVQSIEEPEDLGLPTKHTTTKMTKKRWGHLMTHKYRGCIIVLSINKSVEPNEKQKVLMSSFDQGITVNTSKQVFRGIW
jgi:hypothetical protein